MSLTRLNGFSRRAASLRVGQDILYSQRWESRIVRGCLESQWSPMWTRSAQKGPPRTAILKMGYERRPWLTITSPFPPFLDVYEVFNGNADPNSS